MQSFSRGTKKQQAGTLIKGSLLQQLSYAVKEIQLVISKKDEVFSTNEECNSLIVVLESIFLHGLKKGILKAAFRTVSGEDEAKPTPSFWNAVCNYTHKNTISTIKKLSQVNTDVGRCRVWIRMALNEGELTSYFAAMEKDRRALNNAYSSNAFLRDRENCDTACKLLEGILTVQFQIPTNCSILNTWSSEPLMLSGIWLPPIKTPLTTGVDVVEKMEEDEGDDDSCSIRTSSSIMTLSTILALDEAQALKMILDAPIKKNNQTVSEPPPPQHTKLECDLILEEEESESQREGNFVNQDPPISLGNSLANVHGWSSTEETIPDSTESASCSSSPKPPEEKSKPEDYNSLLEEAGISPSKKINYNGLLRETMLKQNNEDQAEIPPNLIKQSDVYNSYPSKLYKIVREVGLKAQKYTCTGCQISIGLDFGEARLCYFTGEYYCNTCHLNEHSVIPSRVIFNWDHRKYPVCSNAHKYLSEICNHLLIDVKKLNPKLYSAVKEMKKLREIRIQLHMLRAYFYTCRKPTLVKVKTTLNLPEYIYSYIDVYSINDLCRISEGGLISELEAAVEFGRNCVINCDLCSQKGFICEICKNPTIIYPFDLAATYRCKNCSAVYHKTCLSSSKNCPKCKRLKARAVSQSEVP